MSIRVSDEHFLRHLGLFLHKLVAQVLFLIEPSELDLEMVLGIENTCWLDKFTLSCKDASRTLFCSEHICCTTSNVG
jgi:hypothetical protein